MYCSVYFFWILIFQNNKLWARSCKKSKIFIFVIMNLNFFTVIYEKLKPKSLAGCGRQDFKVQVSTWKNKVFGNNFYGSPPGPLLSENRDSPSSSQGFLSVTPAFWVCFPGYFCTGYETLTFIFFLLSSKGEMATEVFSFLPHGYVWAHIYLFPPLHGTLLLVRSTGETAIDSFWFCLECQ